MRSGESSIIRRNGRCVLVKCECGHETCFHRQKGPLEGMFGGSVEKTCAVKGCECVRYTKKSDD
jgi:hypothetical protein